MVRYIKVADEEGEEPIELPLEEDGTLLLSTLSAQFPGTSGLRFRSETNTFRGVKLSEGKFHPPDDDWDNTVYYCVFLKENKRKNDDTTDNLVAKTKRMSLLKCTDLIVLGLPWELTEQRLRTYFESFGELLMAMIKKDSKTGASKGYGFIRFANYETQIRVLSVKHKIDQRTVTVKIPISQEGTIPSSKIFVGRVTEDMSIEDLTKHFLKYGEVVDVFIPKPFRAFAFVTFLDVHVAQSLLGEDHIIKGVSVHIGEANPKSHGSRANSTDGYTEHSGGHYYKPSRDVWGKNVISDYQNYKGQTNSGLFNALGMNPALIAALNQASWMSNMPHGNSISSQMSPMPQMNGNYPSPPASMSNTSPSRPPLNNYGGPPPYRDNWWTSGYPNSRPSNVYNKPGNLYYARRDRPGSSYM